MMLRACLVLGQSFQIFVVADQGKLKTLAPLYRIGNGWASNNETAILYTGQILKLLQFCNESRFVFIGYFRTELEQD